jgi:AraC-like DNA-binding protein
VFADAGQASVRLENSLPLPRAAEDFQTGALLHTHLSAWLPPDPSAVSVHFRYGAEQQSPEHARTFPGTALNFSAAFSGFLFPRAYLEARLERADSKLHQVIRQHAERMLAELPRTQSFTREVRDMVAAELVGGNPSALNVAARLDMSTRTLTRRLEREGMNFKELLDDLRKRLALEYVKSQEITLSEVALLLGFSQTAAFHRAFRRWTGQTPLTYRRAQRR